jgi:flagellum-specific ATP synthase
MSRIDVERLAAVARECDPFQTTGRLRGVTGLTITASLTAAVSDQCVIEADDGRQILSEVIGFDQGLARLLPFEHTDALRPGLVVRRASHGLRVPVGQELLGRVIDGLGRPIDKKSVLTGPTVKVVRREAPPALERLRIREPFCTGQRAIDGLLTCGRGQRVGIFAGSGVGKSTLLGEIAKGAESDVNVIALVGERGREVRMFLEDSLGLDGLRRSVVVVATSDQSPLMRVQAAQTAVSIADRFRHQGKNVLLMLDSMTRVAMAQRELGLALGEPPSARGYTPSVFQLLATLVEQLGTSAHGSITGILTVLVEGGDMDEPVADTMRSLLDGHIVLDRKLAERGHFPAISVAQSVSRVAREVTDAKLQMAARAARAILATYADVEDLIRIGAYAKGSSPKVDRAIELIEPVERFLQQDVGESSTFEQTRGALEQIAGRWI